MKGCLLLAFLLLCAVQGQDDDVPGLFGTADNRVDNGLYHLPYNGPSNGTYLVNLTGNWTPQIVNDGVSRIFMLSPNIPLQKVFLIVTNIFTLETVKIDLNRNWSYFDAIAWDPETEMLYAIGTYGDSADVGNGTMIGTLDSETGHFDPLVKLALPDADKNLEIVVPYNSCFQ